MPSQFDTTAHDTSAPPQSNWQRVVEVLLIVLVFFALTGDPPPNVNEAHYLARLKHFWNPQWAAGDLFLESQDTQIVFIWLFGWVTRFLSLAATAWVGRVMVWTLIAFAWQRLSWRLVPQPLAAVLTAALFATFNEELNLAGEWVVGGVEAKCFAYAFVLLALREMLDRRWNVAWLLLGVATAFHPLVGGWSGVVCFGIWFWNDWRSVSLRSMLPGLIGGALLSLPGIVPALMLTWNEPPELVAEANRIYVFERLPHHLAPLTLPSPELARRLGGHAALVLLLIVLVVAHRGTQRTSLSTLGATGSASDPSSRPRPPSDAQRQHAHALNRIAQFAWVALVIAAVGFVIEIGLWNQHDLAAKLLRYYWFRLTDFAIPMAAALYATALVVAGMQRRRSWAPWAFAICVLIGGWHVARATIDRWQTRLPPADQKIRDFPAWIDACAWAAKNTPADALFLTPRLNLTFKWRAGRAEVANRKDLPQDARSIVEWHGRIRDIYYATIDGTEEPLDSLGILGTERVRELAVKYGADYVLMDRGQLLSLPVDYLNDEYIIYRIENETRPTTR